jgi:hypothetical protein
LATSRIPIKSTYHLFTRAGSAVLASEQRPAAGVEGPCTREKSHSTSKTLRDTAVTVLFNFLLLSGNTAPLAPVDAARPAARADSASVSPNFPSAQSKARPSYHCRCVRRDSADPPSPFRACSRRRTVLKHAELCWRRGPGASGSPASNTLAPPGKTASGIPAPGRSLDSNYYTPRTPRHMEARFFERVVRSCACARHRGLCGR